MRDDELHESVRCQLQVGPDGVVSALGSKPQSVLARARRMFYTGDLILRVPAEKMLSLCQPLSQRLLLSYLVKPGSGRGKSAREHAWAAVFFGSIPVVMAAELFAGSRSELVAESLAVGIGFVVVLALCVYGWQMLKTGEEWEYSAWIDFTSRTWCSRRHFTDGSLPDDIERFPIESLGLICFVQPYEEGSTYGIAICLLKDIEASSGDDPPFLTVLHVAQSKSEAILFGNQLATLWGIDCFGLVRTEAWRASDLMRYLDLHESVRRQLQVGADGVVSAIGGARQSVLELARRLITGNLFGRLPAARILSASKPLPERLLLSYSLQHASERQRFARDDAKFVGFLALFPGLLAFFFISELKSEPFIPAAVVGIGIVLALAVWAYERNMEQVGEVWEYSEWIDFTSRTWNSRRHYNDGGLPDVTRKFRLDSLGLFCYEHGYEGATTYGVAIALSRDIAAAGESDPPRLIEIHEARSQAAAIMVGNELATLWGIDCFSLAPT